MPVNATAAVLLVGGAVVGGAVVGGTVVGAVDDGEAVVVAGMETDLVGCAVRGVEVSQAASPTTIAAICNQ